LPQSPNQESDLKQTFPFFATTMCCCSSEKEQLKNRSSRGKISDHTNGFTVFMNL
jgi:hypothetical protein